MTVRIVTILKLKTIMVIAAARLTDPFGQQQPKHPSSLTRRARSKM